MIVAELESNLTIPSISRSSWDTVSDGSTQLDSSLTGAGRFGNFESTVADHGSAITGEKIRSISEVRPSNRTPHSKDSTSSARLGPEMRVAFREYWKAALHAASQMHEAAKCEDSMGVFTATDDLEVALAELWKRKEARDIDWQTILNHTQGMLRQAFFEKRVESLTQEQCDSIRELVDRFLGPATKSTDDLNEAIRLIEDAGFDPYFAISGDPEE